jgi:hypothetical protein
MLVGPNGKFVGPFGQTRGIDQYRLARDDVVIVNLGSS